MSQSQNQIIQKRKDIEDEFQRELALLKQEQKQVLDDYRLNLECRKIAALKAKLSGQSRSL